MIKVLIGPPGCGKTEYLHNTMLSSPGRWLLALPRTALIDEQAAALTTKVLKNRISPSITAIHSDQPNKRGKVGRRIEGALRDHSSSEHSVVIITHEGLLGVDPTLLEGWGIAVDEVPESGVLSGEFKAGNGWRILADLYGAHSRDPLLHASSRSDDMVGE